MSAGRRSRPDLGARRSPSCPYREAVADDGDLGIGESEDWDPGDADTPEDIYRRGLRNALIRLGVAAEMLTDQVRPAAAVAGSPVAAAHAEDSNWRVDGVYPTPVHDATQNLYLAVTSGHDHVQTLGLSLGMPRIVGTSLYTVIRGAMEAYASAYFLMGDLTVKSILTRHIASRRATLDKTVKEPMGPHGKRYATPLSEKSAEYVDDVKVLAEAWGLSWRDIEPRTYRDKVEDLLAVYAEASGHDLPPNIYGMLSDIAHTENVGFQYFTRFTGRLDEHGRPGFIPSLKYDYLNVQVQILVGVHCEVMKRYLRFCGATQQDCEWWMESIQYCDDMGRYVSETLQEEQAEEDGREGRPEAS
jgi:hypothetical protein